MRSDLFTEAEIADWRQRIAKAHHGRTFKGPVQWIRFAGGPLDGVRTVATVAETKSKFMGWCRVHHRLGPVTALYARTDDPACWDFRSLDIGVQ